MADWNDCLCRVVERKSSRGGERFSWTVHASIGGGVMLEAVGRSTTLRKARADAVDYATDFAWYFDLIPVTIP